VNEAWALWAEWSSGSTAVVGRSKALCDALKEAGL
jgi:hypothetical protein